MQSPKSVRHGENCTNELSARGRDATEDNNARTNSLCAGSEPSPSRTAEARAKIARTNYSSSAVTPPMSMKMHKRIPDGRAPS